MPGVSLPVAFDLVTKTEAYLDPIVGKKIAPLVPNGPGLLCQIIEKELGITKIFITCDETNIGSKKIIEANGGVFEKFFEMREGVPRKMHYWITL